MSYYVESDGDRVPKDVYICDGQGERVLTMECASEDRRFRLARRICEALNAEGDLVRMRLCEQDKVILKPNQKYLFTVDDTCPACVRIAKQAEV